ncbi:DUF6231 family protein [Acidihalobacter prosperus]|uniref:Uncharacterized protein n=1 Tax=Acidihalobacter prosperus TaxID=160660 RepID=A0A1A6C0F7_9GAMM|nr:DUF6231 family protein [Acidihalobacter prosperus]OBS08039.1 hypothetical protein Thpro_022289 [Acidihalobacter prosperus]
MSDPLADLERLASTHPADALLLIAPADHPLSRRLAASGIRPCADARRLLDHPPPRRYPLVLIAGSLETLSRTAGERLIAALRDIHADTLYCLVDADTWPAPDMAALGLRAVGVYPRAAGRLALYHFDLYDYKRTPDWLNARFWAHPERWDKTRW